MVAIVMEGSSCKRAKIEHSPDVVHSGHFMSTRVHDEDQEYRVPVPSPDTTATSLLTTTGEVVDANGFSSTPNVKTIMFTEQYSVKVGDIELDYSELLKAIKILIGRKWSPKWKNFPCCGLSWLHRVRLNNAIWRTWHMQYVRCVKNPPISLRTSFMPWQLNTKMQEEDKSYWRTKVINLKQQYVNWRQMWRPLMNVISHKKTDFESYPDVLQSDRYGTMDNHYTESNLMYLTDALGFDFPDTLFSTNRRDFSRMDMISDNLLDPVSYQPTMGQMYPVFDFSLAGFNDMMMSSTRVGGQTNTDPIKCGPVTGYMQPSTDHMLHGYGAEGNTNQQQFSTCTVPSMMADDGYRSYDTYGPHNSMSAYQYSYDTQQIPVMYNENAMTDPQHSMRCQPTANTNCVSSEQMVKYSNDHNKYTEPWNPKQISVSQITTQNRIDPNREIYTAQPNCYENTTSNPATGDMMADKSPGKRKHAHEQASISASPTAEERRRQHIKVSLDALRQSLPSDPSCAHRSSAAFTLERAARSITELTQKNHQIRSKIEIYKHEIEAMKTRIAAYQKDIPPINHSIFLMRHSASESALRRFQKYVELKTARFWQFFLFSKIMRPLFVSFHNNVVVMDDDKDNGHELLSSLLNWQRRFLDYRSIRLLASNALGDLCHSTSILTDPSLLPDECRNASLK